MIKNNFPAEMQQYRGGRSDGWLFLIDFWADTDEEVLKAVRAFLDEEGYSDIPLPPTAERLWWDYLRPNADEKCRGFIWHPITIYQSAYKDHAVQLHIFNVNYPDHKEFWNNMLNR